MSADNGVYILRTVRNRKEEPKGCWVQTPQHYVWRIAHTQAIDNFEWYQENEPYNLGAYMKEIWGTSPVYMSQEAAVLAANKLLNELLRGGLTVEYGVEHIQTGLKMYGDM